MSTEARLRELIAVIEKNRSTLAGLFDSLESALSTEVVTLGRTSVAALIPAGLLENYYTCLETIMLRISQHFENSLPPHRWHSELLLKMTVHIEGVRPRVFDDATYSRLVELQKFRHFRRYYFEMEYDWDRIDYLVTVARRAHPGVLAGIDEFVAFLRRLTAPEVEG